MFFHFFAWFLNDLFDWNSIWPGFGITALLLFILAAIAGFVAYRLFQKGAPPTPDMAIEQAKLTRAELEAPDDRTRSGQAIAREGRGGRALMANGGPTRSPEMIRASIEETRRELTFSVEDLRSKVAEVTDWRHQLIKNRRTALIGAAVAGFVVGGGVAATISLLTGRK